MRSCIKSKTWAFASMLALGLVFIVNATNPPVNLPPIRAVPDTKGGNVICYGYDCANILESLSPKPDPFNMSFDMLLEDPPVDRKQFCSRLKNNKPSDCNTASPPSTPATDANWQPNGCGNNGFVQTLMSLGISQLVPSNFAGDYNSPYSGVSFQNACNAHDRCYGVAFDKAFCDARFGDEMRTACGVVSDSAGYNMCTGLAGIYEGAVASTNFGISAYKTSAKEYTCAIWVKDMKANECEK